MSRWNPLVLSYYTELVMLLVCFSCFRFRQTPTIVQCLGTVLVVDGLLFWFYYFLLLSLSSLLPTVLFLFIS